MKIIIAALLFVCVFGFALSVSAGTYYMCQNGDDANDGSRASPWLTAANLKSTPDGSVLEMCPIEDVQAGAPPVLVKPICDDVRITYYISYHADGTTTNHNTLKEALESSRNSTIEVLSTELTSFKLPVTGALYETRCSLP